MGILTMGDKPGVCPICGGELKPSKPSSERAKVKFAYFTCGGCGCAATAFYQRRESGFWEYKHTVADDSRNPHLHSADQKIVDTEWNTLEEYLALINSFTEEEVKAMREYMDEHLIERWEHMKEYDETVIDVFIALMYM